MRTINDHLKRDSGQSDELVVPDLNGPFFEYEDGWEKQEEEENDGYYGALGRALDEACARFDLLCQSPYRVDKMVECGSFVT